MITCDREDVLREVKYLIEKAFIKERKERYPGTQVNIKYPSGYTAYYSLTSKAIDLLESPSKYANIGYMINRHAVRVLKASEQMTIPHEYRGDFQPETCFLPIEADVAEGDKVQLLINGEVKDEKIAADIRKFFGRPLEHIEVKWKKSYDRGNTHVININNSSISAPIAQGSGNIVITHNTQTDVDKIIQLISNKKDISEDVKMQATSLVREELPQILNEADSVKARSLTDKLKAIGQTWLVPIIAQVVATYIQYSLGI